ncbi:hypothetical protein JTE87_04158 [Bacillus amyloliquefaciens]|nr:hypothetical protein [Bacillus amyloliquefaciens]
MAKVIGVSTNKGEYSKQQSLHHLLGYLQNLIRRF